MPFQKGNTEASKKGKHAKSKQWEELGDFMTQAGADKAMRILNELPDDEFLDQFGKLLNYFKPRMQSTELTGNKAIQIKVNVPEDNA